MSPLCIFCIHIYICWSLLFCFLVHLLMLFMFGVPVTTGTTLWACLPTPDSVAVLVPAMVAVVQAALAAMVTSSAWYLGAVHCHGRHLLQPLPFFCLFWLFQLCTLPPTVVLYYHYHYYYCNNSMRKIFKWEKNWGFNQFMGYGSGTLFSPLLFPLGLFTSNFGEYMEYKYVWLKKLKITPSISSF